MNGPKKCKHSGCSCMAQGKDDYCSQWCKDARKVTELTCQCRHPECQAAPLKA